jgi:cell division protein FtsI/penicillin-binding protein 2
MTRNERIPQSVSGKRSSKVVTSIVLALYVLMLLQLFRWQVLDSSRFSALASAQLSQAEEIFTKRGTIYTRDEVVLAVDSPSWDVVISLTNSVDQKKFLYTNQDISEADKKKQKQYVFQEIAAVVDTDIAELEAAYNATNLTYQILYKGINKRQKEILESKKLHGVYTSESVKRLYPN